LQQDNPLWEFSLKVYAEQGVSAACLALQDECRVDVNVLLLLTWLHTQDRTLSAAQVGALNTAIADWRSEVTENLRAARRGVGREQFPSLYEDLKRLELVAEKFQQGLIWEWLQNREHELRLNPGLEATSLHNCLVHCLPSRLSGAERARGEKLLREFGNLVSESLSEN
jgi:uncharacterized protein (TIGR02444 family)